MKILAFLLIAAIPVKALAPDQLGGLTPGIAVSFLMLMTTVRVVKLYQGASVIMWFVAVCAISGPVLTVLSSRDHAISWQTGFVYIADLIFAAVTILALLWSRLRIGTAWTAAAYAAGLLVQMGLTPDAWSTNAWKYAFAWPTAVLVLAMLHRSNSRMLTILAFGSIGYASIANDYRSFFGFCVLAAVIHFWSIWRRAGRKGAAIFLVSLTVLGYALYHLAIWMATHGYLGERNRVVTMDQISSSGSALAGARSEIFATIPLFFHRVIGYGPGVEPSQPDTIIGVSGMAEAGIEINERYVHEYMFGDVFKLHSITSDLWVQYGLSGIVLAILLTAVIIKGGWFVIGTGRATGLYLFLAITSLWDLAVSPIGSNLHEVVLAVAILIQPVRATRLSKESRQLESRRAYLD